VEVCLFTIGVMWFSTSGMMGCQDALGGVTRIGVFFSFFCVLCFTCSCLLSSPFMFFLSCFCDRGPGQNARGVSDGWPRIPGLEEESSFVL